MAATYHGPASAFDSTFNALPDGSFSKIFTGATDADVYRQMDETRSRVEAAGGTEVARTKIGRNSPCPCGSGQKYKKCCIDAAAPA